MKNVYLIIAVWLTGLCCYGQDLQNANWYFGDRAGLNFSTGSPVELTDMPTSSTFFNNQILEGSATVSDKNGNLLFYTNGEEVYSYNHQIMDSGTGLYGHESSAQNVVIIPRPGNSNQFYIVTRDGHSGLSQGLHYSIVDLSFNAGLGKVISKNIVLKDHFGANIDLNYNYAGQPKSEKITSTFNSDGINYWLVTQIKNYIYSYSVTASGISLTPINNYLIPIENYASEYIKVSPDGTRIVTTVDFSGTSRVCYIAGNFNTLTGAITNMNINITPALNDNIIRPKEMEFSPNSNFLYFYISGNTSSLHKYNFLTAQTSQVSSSVGFLSRNSLRLAIDGKIYIPSIGTNKFSVINNPDNYSNPGYTNESLNISRNTNVGLPQWVHWHDQPCESLTLASEPNVIFTYYQKSDITAQIAYNLASGTDITMKARDFIVYKPDTHVTAGAKLWAKIENCEGGGSIDRKAYSENTKEPSLKETIDNLVLSPNPATDKVTISSDEAITSVTITSLDGKVMFSRDLSGKDTAYDVDIRSYSKGIYAVNITTVGGNVLTQKLIKN